MNNQTQVVLSCQSLSKVYAGAQRMSVSLIRCHLICLRVSLWRLSVHPVPGRAPFFICSGAGSTVIRGRTDCRTKLAADVRKRAGPLA